MECYHSLLHRLVDNFIDVLLRNYSVRCSIGAQNVAQNRDIVVEIASVSSSLENILMMSLSWLAEEGSSYISSFLVDICLKNSLRENLYSSTLWHNQVLSVLSPCNLWRSWVLQDFWYAKVQYIQFHRLYLKPHNPWPYPMVIVIRCWESSRGKQNCWEDEFPKPVRFLVTNFCVHASLIFPLEVWNGIGMLTTLFWGTFCSRSRFGTSWSIYQHK